VALHVDILDAIAQTIRNLNLDGDPEVRVYKRFNEKEAIDAGIHVCRSSERHSDGTMGADEISFPAVLFMVAGNTGGARENEELLSGWRDEIFEACHLKRDPIDDGAVTENGTTPVICRVDFGEDFLDQFWQKRWDVNHMVVWSTIRKPRT